MKNKLFLSALLIVCFDAYALNKCIDTTGKIIYQDKPCENIEKSKINLLNAQKTPTEDELRRQRWEKESREADLQRENFEKSLKISQKLMDEKFEKEKNEREKIYEENLKRNIEIMKQKIAACNGKEKNKPHIGMSEKDFLCTPEGLYEIEKTNTTTTINGVTKQVILKYQRYIYLTNGVITAIQN